jgi:hypothetical protein
MPIADANDLGDVLGRAGKDDGLGPVLFDRVAVTLVDDQVRRGPKNVLRAQLRA